MKRRLLRRILTDWLATLRAALWDWYCDAGQSIALFEADARAALRRLEY